jgi:hypothetical protein
MEAQAKQTERLIRSPGLFPRTSCHLFPILSHRSLKNLFDSLEKIHQVVYSNEAPNIPTLFCHGGTYPGNKSKGIITSP